MSRFKLATLIFALTSVYAWAIPPGKTEPVTVTVPGKIRNVESKRQCKELLAKGGVFIFYDPSCPICAEYFPTIEELQARYSRKQPFYLILKEADAKLAAEFVEKYNPHCGIMIDKNEELQSSLKAQITPQAFLVKASKTVYSGRIDDRYESIGQRRTVIRSRDLEDALKASSTGNRIAARETQAIGCFLEQIKKAGSKNRS